MCAYATRVASVLHHALPRATHPMAMGGSRPDSEPPTLYSAGPQEPWPTDLLQDGLRSGISDTTLRMMLHGAKTIMAPALHVGGSAERSPIFHISALDFLLNFVLGFLFGFSFSPTFFFVSARTI